jgi:hypothetical protein
LGQNQFAIMVSDERGIPTFSDPVLCFGNRISVYISRDCFGLSDHRTTRVVK